MKKKLLSLFLVGALAASMVAGCGEPKEKKEGTKNETEDSGESEESGDNVTYSNKQVVIGDISETSGDINPYWNNNASDYNAYKMIRGLQTVTNDREGKWLYDEKNVVEKAEETENEDGSKTWTYTIKDGLKFSNNDPITAKNYVFFYLFWSSPVTQVDLKAALAPTVGQYLKGYDAYVSGESKTLEGVHLIDDKTFSITIDAQWLPYYYGKALTAAEPETMKWVPEDITIEETETGAKLSDNFTAEYVGDQVEKYRYNPTACSGPYMFDSYDANGYAYTLKRNPNYPGNFEGQKANIETVIYKYVETATMLDQLKTGAIDLLQQCSEAKEIEGGLDLVDEGGFNYVNYSRAGYGMLSFKCNQGPTQFQEVRQAVTFLLDRNAFAQTFTGGHGIIVHGPYGSQQWMVEEYADQIDTLNTYNYSVDSAINVLEEGGWVLNEDGSDYAGTGIRYKKLEDGTMMPLVIEWFASEKNPVADLLVTSLKESPDLEAAGMKINQTVGTFNELLDHYYDNTTENKYQMFNLANGFANPYDVANQYKPGSGENTNAIEDEELYNAAMAMNQTEEGDDEAYVENWFKFIKRWNELMPEVPLYSNDYHDFFTDKLHDFEQNGYDWNVETAILYANME